MPASASVWSLRINGVSVGTTYYSGTQEACQLPGPGIVRDVEPCQGATLAESFKFETFFTFDTAAGTTQVFGGEVDPPAGWRFHSAGGTVTYADGAFRGTGIYSYADIGFFAPVPFPGTGIPSYAVFEGVPVFSVSFVRTIEGTAPVPEPATWAMLIAGFAMLGGVMRRGGQTRPRLA